VKEEKNAKIMSNYKLIISFMFKLCQQSQAQLLPPPSLDEALAKNHIARLINHAVDTMDLSFIEG
jgi:hypothetical protein